MTLPQESVRVYADPNRLAQVVSNLLNNAAKYTPQHGRIWLTVDHKDNDVTISVKDTGIGVPPDDLDRVFEMFTQIDRPIERGGNGLGIGLTLVKSLVEMHDGTISVESEGANMGTTFRVTLPIAEGNENIETHYTDSTENSSPPSHCRVLIVDDNGDAANIMAMVIKKLGNEVQVASDGEMAVRMAEKFHPDVILMDLGMPKMNGYEAAQEIRRHEWGKNMILVALTGWGQEEDRRRTKEAGFNYHLVKPADTIQLRRLFANLEDKT